jgi:molecular chaperone DnaK
MGFCGIDFGTTNTAMVYFSEHAGMICVGAEEENIPLPSIVALNKHTGAIVVGSDVKRNIQKYTRDYEIVLSIKTVLDDPRQEWNVAGRIFKPVDVAAEIFKTLKQNAAKRKIDISEIVISVPVNFSSGKKRCLREAARQAGLEIKKFVNEPLAAFLAHYEELKSFSKTVIFDWGGGTLDIAALDIKNDTIRELYTDNMYKAGDNIDKDLARYIYEKSVKKDGLSLIPFDKIEADEYDELVAKAERAKIYLSKEGQSQYEDFCSLQGKICNITVTYEELCNVSENIVNEAIRKLNNVITKAYNERVSCILCVGGSSNLRNLKEKLKKIYGDILYFPDSPEWDIAYGACTIDASKRNNVYKLAHDINLILSNGDKYPLLKEGQLIPCKESKIHLSTVDCAENANFVFQVGQDEYHEITIPLLGGADEAFDLITYIDEYSVLNIEMRNNKIQEHERYNIFQYEKPDLCYNV